MSARSIKLSLISDELTQIGLCKEMKVILLKPRAFRLKELVQSADLLFVESAWSGCNNTWKYKIASYPDYPKRNNKHLAKIVNWAKEVGVPTVFWNKEDGVHFERFIESAKLFDHILTVDGDCIEKYRQVVSQSTSVDVGLFCVQPKIHNYQGYHYKHEGANFIGSYSTHIHDKRRERQAMLFGAAQKAGLPLTIFDRNSDRSSSNYRYPEKKFNLKISPKIYYFQTADIYRDYLVSLNVNTVEGSPTMFSRRVIEVLACGSILVTTPSMAVERLFKDYCHIVYSFDEAVEVFSRLKQGPSKEDIERARAGSDFVLNNFTWRHFMEKVYKITGLIN